MTKNSLNKPQARQGILREILASVVVFLIALPLCMGIAIASGVPPALGLITGIIGGLVVGSISGSPLQVSGPAAGVAVVIFELVQKHGLAALGPVVILAGLIQLSAGLLKLGRWFRAVSPAVIHGMLAGIGVLIMFSQLQVMIDSAPKSSGLGNILAIPQTIVTAFSFADGTTHHLAAAIGILTILVLVGWKHLRLDKLTLIPAALPAVVIAAVVAKIWSLPVEFIVVPHNLLHALNVPAFDGFARLINASGLASAFCLAFIASAETLLSAAAIDQMHDGQRAQFNKELVAQGVGNTLCGLLGALPMTGVIIRSRVNVEAGAKTRLSTILHGAWLLLVIVTLPWLLEHIPQASLAALLVYTGFKLVDLDVVKRLLDYGRSEVMIYATTVTMIVLTDLLTGVLVGLLCSLIKLVWLIAQLEVELVTVSAKEFRLTLRGSATFLGLPSISEALEQVSPGCHLDIKTDELVYIDHACLELLHNWEERHKQSSGTLTVNWDRLMQHYWKPATASK